MDREKTIAHEMSYCQHYKVTPGAGVLISCAIGEDRDAARERAKLDNPNPPLIRPCIHGHELKDPLAACPKWIRKTREMGEARADLAEQSLRRMRLVGPVVSEWRTWSPKNRVAKQEVIECPACKGRLHLSQAAYNGHVWGQCETNGCVSWMA